jgi:hypothetical protein
MCCLSAMRNHLPIVGNDNERKIPSHSHKYLADLLEPDRHCAPFASDRTYDVRRLFRNLYRERPVQRM